MYPNVLWQRPMRMSSLNLILIRWIANHDYETIRPKRLQVQMIEYHQSKYNYLTPLKTASMVNDLSSTVAMKCHCFSAGSRVRGIRRAIGRD